MRSVASEDFLHSVEGVFKAGDSASIRAELEILLPALNVKVDKLVEGNRAIYDCFLNSSFASDPVVSALLLRFICERILRSSNAWVMHGGGRLCVPSQPAMDDLLFYTNLERERCSNPFSDYYAAIVAHLLGDDSGSLKLFSSATMDLGNRPQLMQSDEHGMLQLRPYHFSDILEESETFSFSPRWIASGKQFESAEGTVACFCDDVYFQAFAPNLIASVQRSERVASVNLHFHVTNPGDRARKMISELGLLVAGSNLTLSFSEDFADVRDRAYFTCTRFLAIPFLFERFSKVVVVDADSEFKRSPVKLFDELQGSDMGLMFSRGPWGYKPWRRYWAGCCYFENTPNTGFFLTIYSRLLSLWWNSSEPRNWWIDQNCLFFAMRYLRNFVPGHSVREGDGLFLDYLESSEELKLNLLEKHASVAAAMDAGKTWNEALAEIQLQ